MDISLTPELERRIAEPVASGRYADASEVVRAGLEQLFEADAQRIEARQRLDAMLQVGIDQLDRGEGIPWSEARERIEARLRSAR